jgi:hypothetical protein
MVTKLINKINILCTNSKVLVIGKLNPEVNESLHKYFKTIDFLDITQETKNILNQNLYDQYNIVVFVPNSKELFPLIPHEAIVILKDTQYLDFKDYNNQVYAVLLDPMEEKALLDKIYGLLALAEIDIVIKAKEKLIKKYNKEEVSHNIDEFLDKYTGNMMFINDDLNESLENLRNLELSKENFKNIATALFQLSVIFAEEQKLLKVSKVCSSFAELLINLELESIEPSNYGAFDLLTQIIEDLTIYIDELFVYKILKDVHLFEDSMQNNIEYFEVELLGREHDHEDLEFF